ncbi:hypothetical protein PSFL_07560 [Pseudomonas sp. DD1]
MIESITSAHSQSAQRDADESTRRKAAPCITVRIGCYRALAASHSRMNGLPVRGS